MSIVGGLDVHRKQITFEYLDTGTGELSCGQVTGADRRRLAEWLGRFAGREDVGFAVEACTGWRYVVEELQRAGVAAHLADPAETAAARGRKRRAKTDPLTEPSSRCLGLGVRARAGLARFRSRDQRSGCAARLVRAGGPAAGALEATGDLFEPYRLVDGDGVVVEPARAFFAELAAVAGRRRRSVRTGWICCAGSGSCGCWGSAGIRRLVSRRATSAAGCRFGTYPSR